MSGLGRDHRVHVSDAITKKKPKPQPCPTRRQHEEHIPFAKQLRYAVT
jgi:hypothetical protein